MTKPTASSGAPAPPLRPRRLLARARRHALVAGALIGVLALTAACTGTAGAVQSGQEGGGDNGGSGIACPDVASLLTDVPEAAQGDVDSELAALENQIAEANDRLANSVGEGGPNFVENAILGPLADKRAATLDRIGLALEQAGGEAPDGLADLAECALEDDDAEDDDAEDEDGNEGNNDDGEGNDGDGDGDYEDENGLPDDEDDDGDDSNNDDDDNAELDEDEQRLLELVPGIEFAGDVVNGNRTLGQDCSVSDLGRHDGFESDEAVCVETAAGEQPAFDQGAQLLITDFPQQVGAGEDFTYTVSTRNLVRARFLGAADGGYYAESSFLTNEGLQLGHFHTGCRPLSDGLDAAPEAGVLPDFFQAVEDFGGGAEPDFVEIEVPGLDTPGLYQCAAWGGEPSHRVPMMATAQQIPAFDTFLLEVQ